MAVDPAWRAVPKKQSCFLVWRIEKLEVKPVPRDQYGSFYTGDAYLVLALYPHEVKPGTEMQLIHSGDSSSYRGLSGRKSREARGALDMHIHFWLGSKSTQDERGCAAIKAVELDDYLGGTPVQHREVEGSESSQFLQYFPKGISYLQGGVASGFNHVTKEIVNRLLHVKGKHHVRIREVEISWNSMNEGDVFILDLHTVVFVWIGKQSSRTERLKGMEAARKIRDERGGNALIRDVMDGSEAKDLIDVQEYEMFNACLPIKKKKVKTAAEGGADEKVEKQMATILKLYVCREESGTLKVTEKKTGPLYKSDLDRNDSFIIDNGPNGIWVWNGKQASKLERQQAMRNAEGFLKKKGYPPNTPITRVCDGGEPYMFKALFLKWSEPVSSGKVFTYNRIAKTVQTKFDATTLHNDQRLAAETQMVDDGSGSVEVFRVERVDEGGAPRYELKPVARKSYGQFFMGDCYVIIYKYQSGNNREACIIYFWQGRKSTQDEVGASAFHAQQIDNVKFGGQAVQVRVVQGKEPAHFMAIFQGKMIIFEGGKSGWGQKGDSTGPGDTYLLHIRGTSSNNAKATQGGKAGWGQQSDVEHSEEGILQVRGNTHGHCRATQVDLTAESLNSNDVFVLFTRTSVFIWAGKGSTGDEREMARELATKWSPKDAVMVIEGQERKEFWDAIGGKKPYSNDRRLQEENPTFEPRLFQASNASGRFLVEEIQNFTQDDLVHDDVMILDAWDNIYVWIGNGANKIEREQAGIVAQEYVRADPAGRDPDTPIYQVKQGYEPPSFTGFFGVWDNDLWNKGKTWEQLKQELQDGNKGITIIKDARRLTIIPGGPRQSMAPGAAGLEPLVENGPGNFGDVAKFPYETLILKDVEEGLPEMVDTTAKELYLSDADFQKVFGMTYEKFATLPTWRQQQVKKAKQLF